MYLREFNDINFTKDEFIDYYNRCICFGLTVCEDAVFKICESKYIMLDLKKVKDSYVKVPSFVDSLAYLPPNPYTWTHSNKYIKELDLNKVKTIGGFALEGYDIEVLHGPNLLAIGSEAFRSCNKLKSLDLPKLRQVGDKAFYFCTHLESFNAPSLVTISKEVFRNCYSLTSINVPNLRELKFLGYGANHNIINLNYTRPLKMSMQDCVFRDVNTKEVFNWTGEVLEGFNRESYRMFISSEYTKWPGDPSSGYIYQSYRELKSLYKCDKHGFYYKIFD